jgi:hypothetical protein
MKDADEAEKPRHDLPVTWYYPNCFEPLDISAPKSTGVKVCPCRRAGVDWDRGAGLLREVRASPGGRDLPRWGW